MNSDSKQQFEDVVMKVVRGAKREDFVMGENGYDNPNLQEWFNWWKSGFEARPSTDPQSDGISLGGPCISSMGLRKLAEEAERCGAQRYADAYRLVAARLDELGAERLLGKRQPEDHAD